MIIQGNALTVLKGFDADSIDCVVTSPPYWSLRKYDIPDVIFDGVEGCEHEWGNQKVVNGHQHFRGFEWQTGGQPQEKESVDKQSISQGQFCLHCSAWRGQLGLEPTFELYLKHLLEIFDEVKRVLKPEGTMFVNLGDSYAGSGKAGNNPEYQERHTEFGKPSTHSQRFGNPTQDCSIPAKSLCLIPYRFAIAMIDRGWICRNLINWWKRNCMPSSAKDRFTVDFEPVFFFVKSRKYWFEQQYEPHTRLWDENNGGNLSADSKYFDDGRKLQKAKHVGSYPLPNPQGRNKRCVWDVPTQPYPESHFATFPEALVEPMIRAGCPKDGVVLDPFCGSGTALRVAEKLGRKAIGIDLGYEELAEKRLKNNQMELI